MALETIVLLLSAIIVTLIFIIIKTHQKLSTVSFQKSSLSTRYGKMSEQFLPFLKDYPYDPQRFRFIGSPIDGVQFSDEKIVFVEFKAGDSRLTEKQKQIKTIIEQKKVEFKEIAIQ